MGIAGTTRWLLAALALTACADGENAPRWVDGGGAEGSLLACTEEVMRRLLSAAELADAGTPLFLSTLDEAAPAERRFVWTDATGMRRETVIHVQLDANFAQAVSVERRTAGASASCADLVEYAATLSLSTEDGALQQLIPGALSEMQGRVTFVADVPSSSFTGAFAPRGIVHVAAAWSEQDLREVGRPPTVQLVKLQLTNVSAAAELAALRR